MLIIEIAALDNGAHRNQNINGGLTTVPDGWAVVPSSLGTAETLENFPFGDITVDSATPPAVTSWTPLPIPEPEPVPEPETEPSVWDELDAAYTEGVNAAYDQ